MNIDKDLVQKAVDEAFAKIMEDSKKYEDDDIIYSDENEDKKDEELKDMFDDEASPDDDINEEDKDEGDVQDKIEEEIEEAVDENPDYNFLGLEINIEKTEDGKKFNVKISKDDKEKVEVLDSIELPNILGLIEDFFNELVLEDESEEENEEDEDEEFNDEEDVDIDEDEEEDNELSESYYPAMASLRRRYKDRVEEFFEHGLLAKELALEMIKDNLTKSTVKELVDTMKEKDSIIADKKADLQKLSLKYLQAKKMENSLKKARGVLGSIFKDLSEKVEKREISPITAKKIAKKYRTIISSIVEAKDPQAVMAAVNTINKVQNAILANVSKTKFKKSRNVESVVSKPRNVLNKEGKVANSTLLSNRRYDGIDEMSAEILRIAGINDH